MAYGDNPDINYVPGETRRVSVPRLSETERSVQYADALAERDRKERLAREIEANARANLRETVTERARARAARAAAVLEDPALAAQQGEQQGAEQFAGAYQALGSTAVTGKRPGYGARKEYTDTMLGTPQQPGLVEQGRTYQQLAHDAELERARVAASATEDLADRQLQAMKQLRANQQAQAKRESDQIERLRRVNDVAIKAADELSRHSDIDPGRYWRNAPAWQKFTAAIAAGLLGWAGRTDPTAHITNAIAMDIDAQKAAIAKASQQVSHLQNQATREESLYERIRAQTQSVREADLTYTAAMLDHARNEMVARLQRAGVKSLNAQQMMAINSLDQQIAAVKRGLGLEVAANTPTVTVMRQSGNADQRALLRTLGTEGVKNMSEARQQLVDVTKAREKMRLDAAMAGVKGPSADEERVKFVQRSYVDKESRSLRTEVKNIEEFQKDYSEDIPGYGTVGWFGRVDLTDEQQKAYRRLVRIVMLRLRPESGAAISDSEIDRESGGVIGGKRTENSTAIEEAKQAIAGMDEADIRGMLDERLAEAKFKIDLIERVPMEEHLGRYLQSEVGPKAAIPSSSVGTPSGVTLREVQ